MKRILFTTTIAVALIVAVATTNTSCVKVNFDETQIIDTSGTGGPGTPSTLQGRIDNSLTLPKGKYTLRGFVYVGSGATLTFAAGSVILAATDVKSALIIEVGGKIIADGTSTEPIVFTSSKAVGQRTPGDWGGISICGAAPTNRPLSPAPITEGGSNRPYGGTNANDNSGVLRYVRIEFAGITAENNSELNGLTLYAVGAGTIIDYVQTGYCGDDGFEFFGGTVNAKHLVSFATGDDDFDFDFGFAGRIQYAVSLRDKYSDDDAANGIECDNDGSGTTAAPITRPILSNFTLIGPYDTAGTTANGSQHGSGNRWRRSANFVLNNSLLVGFKASGLLIESANAFNDFVTNSKSDFKNNIIAVYRRPYRTDSVTARAVLSTGHAPNPMTSAEREAMIAEASDLLKAKAEAQGTTTLADRDAVMLTAPFTLNSPNFVPATGSPALTGASYTGMDAFFTTGTYRGAFGTENWLAGWSNFDPQNTTY